MRSLLALVALLIAGAALAQEQGQHWLGVNAQDVTKEEADKLGWEAPRGVKVTAHLSKARPPQRRDWNRAM